MPLGSGGLGASAPLKKPILIFFGSSVCLSRALPIPSPNLGEGIPLFQFWCGDFIPLPNFLKLHLVWGFYPKLVRGEQSKKRGSNEETVWRRARTPDGVALHP